MAITAADIVSDDDVRAVLEERTQEQYQFRRAYREHDATGINSGSFEFPQADDSVRNAMDEVGEEATYPSAGMNYSGVSANYTKDGFIVEVSDEAVDDSAFDVIMDVTEEMAIGAEKRLDSRAWALMDPDDGNNLNTDSPVGTDTNDMNYDAIVNAYTELFEDEMVPSDFELYLSADAFGDLATDSQFTHATDQGDQVVVQGELQLGFGVPIVPTNTGDLADDEGNLVDTGRYGYESTRWDREVSSERDFDNDLTKYKIRHRKDFVVMRSEAGIHIQGGV